MAATGSAIPLPQPTTITEGSQELSSVSIYSCSSQATPSKSNSTISSANTTLSRETMNGFLGLHQQQSSLSPRSNCNDNNSASNFSVYSKAAEIAPGMPMDNNLTLISSTLIGPIPSRLRRRQRISILKKLKEKLVTNQLNDERGGPCGAENFSLMSSRGSAASSSRSKNIVKIGVNQPTTNVGVVVGGGTVSSVGSGVSTLRSWRLMDDLFRSGRHLINLTASSTSPSRHSTLSSCRSVFSNKTLIYDDKSLEIRKPAFCTIVNVDSTAATTISGQRAPGQTTGLESHGNNARSINQSATGQHSAASVPQSPNGHHLNDRHAVNLASAGNCSVRLTGWRLRPDPDAESLTGNVDNNNNNHADAPFTTLNALAAEELPRIFGTSWPLPPMMPPGGRFEDSSIDEPKGCCGTSRPTHSLIIRTFIMVISLIGLSCVIVGIVLGALTVSGSTRLTLCLLMIGVGVVLIIVSGIAWRLTSLDPTVSLSCWNILGLRSFRNSSEHSFMPDANRAAANYFRVRNQRHSMPPFTNLPPEFLWRPPPPTYQATVQEIRLQNIFNARMRNSIASPVNLPPPTYRVTVNSDSNHTTPQRPSLNDYTNRSSRPPSYSSRTFERLTSSLVQQGVELAFSGASGSGNNGFDVSSESRDTNRLTEASASTAAGGSRSENVGLANQHVTSDDDKLPLIRNDHLIRSDQASQQRYCSHINNSMAAGTSSAGDSAAAETAGLSPAQQHLLLPPQSRIGAAAHFQDNDTVSVIDCSEAVPVVVERLGNASRANNYPVRSEGGVEMSQQSAFIIQPTDHMAASNSASTSANLPNFSHVRSPFLHYPVPPADLFRLRGGPPPHGGPVRMGVVRNGVHLHHPLPGPHCRGWRGGRCPAPPPALMNIFTNEPRARSSWVPGSRGPPPLGARFSPATLLARDLSMSESNLVENRPAACPSYV